MSLPRSLTTVSYKFGSTGGMLCMLYVAPLLHAQSPLIAAEVHNLSPAVQAAGEVLGEVRNAAGAVQMGATVLLFNRYEQLVRRAVSNRDGKFVFDALTPDVYSVKVSLASFVPALRRNIAVLSGTENLLRINLATLFSSVDVITTPGTQSILLTDEWKWVLRSSHATRPILRLAPQVQASTSAAKFTETTGVVRLSAGPVSATNAGSQQALGTAFGLETSVYDGSTVRVSGNLGYNPSSGLPAAALRTTYSRQQDGEPGPEIALTVRQAYFPGAMSMQGSDGTPVLRTAALSMSDATEVLDFFKLEYGMNVESIALFGRINYVSPFARLTYDLQGRGVVKVAYSNGAPPAELAGTRDDTEQSKIDQDLTALALAPRISRRDNQAGVERTKSYEVGYQYVEGSRTYRIAAFHEEVSNAAFLMSGSTDLVGADNLLPDLNSRGTVFNLGNFRRNGYSASVRQAVGQHLEFVAAVGRAGALVTEQQNVVLSDGDDIRNNIHRTNRSWATVRASGSLRATGTRLSAGYGWTDFRALMPVHASLTNQDDQQVGWNISVRQPLPRVANMRMEVSAELLNILAQGYLSVHSSQGCAVLTNAPRAVRGGLSFIF